MKRLRTTYMIGWFLTVGLVVTPASFATATEGEHSQEQEHEEPLYWRSINWIHWGDMQRPPLVFVLANFGLFVLVLRRTLFRKARQVAQERHEQIKLAIERAQNSLQQAEQSLQQAVHQMEQLNVVRAEWTVQAQHEAALERAHVQKETEMFVQNFRRDMERRLHLERNRIEAELQQGVLKESIEQAKQWLMMHFGPGDQQKQVTQIISSLHALAERRREI